MATDQGASPLDLFTALWSVCPSTTMLPSCTSCGGAQLVTPCSPHPGQCPGTSTQRRQRPHLPPAPKSALEFPPQHRAASASSLPSSAHRGCQSSKSQLPVCPAGRLLVAALLPLLACSSGLSWWSRPESKTAGLGSGQARGTCWMSWRGLKGSQAAMQTKAEGPGAVWTLSSPLLTIELPIDY